MARFLKNRKKLHGEAPGSLIFVGKQKMKDIRIVAIQYNATDLIESEIKNTEQLRNLPNGNLVTWINIYGLHNIEIINQLGELYQIPPLLLEDIVNTDQRPRYVEDEKYAAVFLKNLFFKPDDEKLHAEQISFILGKNILISFQERQGAFFEPVRERIRKSRGRVRTSGVDYLCYALLDTIIDNYLLHIESIGDKVETLEEVLLNENRKNIVDEIYRNKIEITFLRKAIRPARELMVQLIKSDSVLIHKKTRTFFVELEDLVTQALEAVEVYYTMISDQLNIYHANLSNKVNDVMKVLTIYASIFIPLTFIAGVYGTNFDNIPELHFKYGYFGMLGIMFIVALIMIFYFRRKNWF